jgi:hypothetical protein
MAKLFALGPVSHDGEDYEFGDAFEVKDKKQAEALISAKAASTRKPAEEDLSEESESAGGEKGE